MAGVAQIWMNPKDLEVIWKDPDLQVSRPPRFGYIWFGPRFFFSAPHLDGIFSLGCSKNFASRKQHLKSQRRNVSTMCINGLATHRTEHCATDLI